MKAAAGPGEPVEMEARRPRRQAKCSPWSVGFAVVACLMAIFVGSARAEPAQDVDARAREEFRAGARLIEQSEWAAAIAAFERSRALREHALTIYNIGVCQRFLGRYTLALQTLRFALSHGARGSELPELFRDQARAYVDEIESKLARLRLTLTTPNAKAAVDGRPLEAAPSGELVAGVALPGQGKEIGVAPVVVVVDPGAHVLTFQLEGHDTIEVRREMKPGATESLTVSLTEQDSELLVDADRSRSVVRVDDVDVGLTPITVVRPPGRHTVTVVKEGFVPYRAAVTLRPGQHTRLAAELPVERVPVTKRWWFWTGAASVLAAGVLVTYVATKPGPQPPPYEGGSTGWLVPVR